MPTISRVLETCLYATDLPAMEAFYSQVLGFKKISSDLPIFVFFKVSDDSVLLIFNPEESAKSREVPSHGAKGPGHVALSITHDDLQSWRDILAQHSVPIEHEMNWSNGAKSIYFRDPANNSVELVTSEIWDR